MFLSEKKLVQLDNLNKESLTLEELDLSNGFVCDFETGICGPVDEINEQKSVEERNNANNNMV